MKILHTADWHLGARLYRQSREQEHAQFLEDLLQLIQREQVEALLIAGDVFDSANPSLAAQALYYRFLAQLLNTSCRQTIIIAGNHDSNHFLALPQALLQILNIHIVTDVHQPVIPLYDAAGELAAVVAAAPYLRERDLRAVSVGESYEDSEEALLQGIEQHYQKLLQEALQCRGTADVPLLAMGHLFSSGASISDDEAIRDLYVGKLGHFPAQKFSPEWDYVALGHIHRPQKLKAETQVYYSGSPIPLSFGEASTSKQVLLLQTAGRNVTVEALPLPNYQTLRRLESASLEDLKAKIQACADEGVWLEVRYTGEEIRADLYEELQALLQGRRSKILRLLLPNMNEAMLGVAHAQHLQHLQPEEVFDILLQQKEIPEAQALVFKEQFAEILQNLREEALPA